MSATTITQTGTLFPEQLVTELINKVNGHSTLAKLSAQTPQPFTGEKEMVFTMDDEAEIVGEGEAKSAADAKFAEKVIKPVKFVYQHRVSDEFKHASEERRIRYLKAFADGFAKKIARGFDIAAFHGINPRNKSAASFRSTNSFYGLLAGDLADRVIAYDPDAPDENLQDAIDVLVEAEENVSGIAMAPAFAAAMGKVQNGINEYRYPEFRFGGRPNSFSGLTCDTNGTVSFAPQTVSSDVLTTMAVAGDFANSFRWGYSEKIPLEIIEYGDPDGTGRDLKRYNEVCLRSEAYIGWAILFPEAFALIRKTDAQ